MDKNLIAKKIKYKKYISICIKISEKRSKWLKENNYSPTGIFEEACKDLGFEE